MKKLFLDDKRNPWDDTWSTARDQDEFINYIEVMGLPDVISFDCDLKPDHYVPREVNTIHKYRKWVKTANLDQSGRDCAKWLTAFCDLNNLQLPVCRIHSANPYGSKDIMNILVSYAKIREGRDLEVEYKPYKR